MGDPFQWGPQNADLRVPPCRIMAGQRVSSRAGLLSLLVKEPLSSPGGRSKSTPGCKTFPSFSFDFASKRDAFTRGGALEVSKGRGTGAGFARRSNTLSMGARQALYAGHASLVLRLGLFTDSSRPGGCGLRIMNSLASPPAPLHSRPITIRRAVQLHYLNNPSLMCEPL